MLRTNEFRMYGSNEQQMLHSSAGEDFVVAQIHLDDASPPCKLALTRSWPTDFQGRKGGREEGEGVVGRAEEQKSRRTQRSHHFRGKSQ